MCAPPPRNHHFILILSCVSRVLHTFFYQKTTKITGTTSPTVATKPCKPHDRSLTFQNKYAFRSSVVTSMCAPPTRNHYFIFTFSDVSRIWSTLLACVMSGSNGRHRVSKIHTIWSWSLTRIGIIWFVDTRCACTMIIVHAYTMIIIHAYSMIAVHGCMHVLWS